MAQAAAISIRGLQKIYQKRGKGPAKHALKGIDLDIPQGSLFALLGPNGAGKSTLINIMAGLVLKSAGQMSIWGTDIDADPRRARASIGIVPQELNIDAFFTPRALLDLQAGLFGVPKDKRQTEALLAAMGLTDKANAYARTLSGGMRRRLMVAKAMVHSPPILVLDEPTAGVDIELRQQLWANVRDLNRQGVTVLLTTHYLEEAEELCDRIAIIANGELRANETKEALLARLDGKELHITLSAPIPEALPEPLAALGLLRPTPDTLLLRHRRLDGMVPRVLAALSDAGLTIADLRTAEADLEDVFLQLTRATPAAEQAA
ncbi:ABC transporter ATP-binding protein [Elstera cyanobacteriorum]|uniref:ABC transporter ATP-binding protein n=1 Tax=Elstera cyanobacteriorum TaxID=2022747 RepID=UPI002356DC13|nr:ABC transporter ATP-binding protein [Elstera cyanobacteriorum]MCK6442771.1 ABC transporter ATP-binding protein [Elstera cyanobacteriorum]